MTGRFSTMMDVLFRQNASYAGNLWHNLGDITRPADFGGRAVQWTFAPLGLIAAWFLFAVGRPALGATFPRVWLLWTAWALGTWTAIALPGQFFPHYYQLAMPVLVMAAGWCAEDLIFVQSRGFRILGRLSVLACFPLAIWGQFRFYSIPGSQWADAKNFGNFSEQYRLADRINATLKPGEQFWNFGQDTTLYFASHRSPPTGLLYLDPLKPGQGAPQYWQRLLTQLHQTRPDLIVLTRSQYWSVGADAPIFPWLDQNYIALGVDPAFPSYALLVRNDSELRGRLSIRSRLRG